MYRATLDGELTVAVKFLNPSDVGTHEINRQKFESEIQIMRLCRHENIIGCLGSYIKQVWPCAFRSD